jgi:hypothetical protein
MNPKKPQNLERDIVITLFDYTGAWSLPYQKAGYLVFQVDLKLGIDILFWNYKFIDKKRVAVILAAPPCTDYTSAGAQYWKKKDKNGSTALSNSLVEKTLEIIDYFYDAELIFSLENPAGRLRRMLQGKFEKGEPTFQVPQRLQEYFKKPSLVFNPSDYGDPWTKQTCLWGKFHSLKKVPIEEFKWAAQGSWTQLLGGKSERTKELRSVTPAGFTRAFFEANNPLGKELEEHLYFFGRCKYGMWTCDFAVSQDMCDVCEDGDNYETNEYAMEFDTEEDFMKAIYDKGEGLKKSIDPERLYHYASGGVAGSENMKITKAQLSEANRRLKAYNLELCISPMGKVQCFCTTLKQDTEQLCNMNMINSEIAKASTYSDIKWLTYFEKSYANMNKAEIKSEIERINSILQQRTYVRDGDDYPGGAHLILKGKEVFVHIYWWQYGDVDEPSGYENMKLDLGGDPLLQQAESWIKEYLKTK